MDSLQVILSISVPTSAVLVGMLINNSRLSDLRAHMDVRFADVDRSFTGLEKLFDEKLLRVEQGMDARLTSIEKDLEEVRPRAANIHQPSSRQKPTRPEAPH